MENYRKKLETQNGLFLIGALILIAVQILAFAQIITPVTGDAHWHNFWNGMMAGMSLGVTAFFIAGIVLNLLALHSEKRLKKMYAKQNDERAAKVVSQAQAMALQTFLILGLVAVIVAGYFNPTVSVTILACDLAASFTALGYKIYFNLKY